MSGKSDRCHSLQGTRKASAVTHDMLSLKDPGRCRRWTTATITAAVLLVTLLSMLGQAWGQQHQYVTPRPSITNNQGSVLELPRTLGSQEELKTRSHAPRKQPGYKQVTLTVTDQNGRYVTGLQKSDFRIYVDDKGRSV